jgi:hypothetical protein
LQIKYHGDLEALLLREHYKVIPEEYSKEGLVPCTVLKAETIFFTCLLRKVTLHDTLLVSCPYNSWWRNEEVYQILQEQYHSLWFSIMALGQLFLVHFWGKEKLS